MTVEDMEQEAALIAWEALDKYEGKKGSLGAFLWAHVHNRLFNFKRDNFQRPDRPNADKVSIMCPTDISGVDEKYSVGDLKDATTDVDAKYIRALIDENMSVRLRPYWLQLINGVTVKKGQRDKVMAEVRQILETHNINMSYYQDENEDGEE